MIHERVIEGLYGFTILEANQRALVMALANVVAACEYFQNILDDKGYDQEELIKHRNALSALDAAIRECE